MTGSIDRLPPQYDVATVEALLLEVAVDLHPERLSADELPLKVVVNAEDAREMEVAKQAIWGLREYGLFSVREDGVVVPTPAALRAVALGI